MARAMRSNFYTFKSSDDFPSHRLIGQRSNGRPAVRSNIQPLLHRSSPARPTCKWRLPLARSAESPLSRDDPGDSAFCIRVTLDLIRPREVTYAALLAKGEHFRSVCETGTASLSRSTRRINIVYVPVLHSDDRLTHSSVLAD